MVVTIPDLDETTIRAIAVQAAGQCSPESPLQLIAWADMIQDFIDPLADDGEITPTLEKQP